jgi:hypothetical protein
MMGYHGNLWGTMEKPENPCVLPEKTLFSQVIHILYMNITGTIVDKLRWKI